MSMLHHNPADRAAESAARFAHELANLLDGSMRNVSIVRSLLDGKNAPREVATAEVDLLSRLQTAEGGMKQMARLLKNWLADHHHPATVTDAAQTLGDVVSQAHQLHAPAASAMGIEINVHITSEAARLPAGPVFTIIANGLRNSIEAIAANPRRKPNHGLIEIRAQVQAGRVRICIADNGPGLARELFDTTGIFRYNATTKPDGHGLGLAISRDIATSLGGTLRITNRDEGGTQLLLNYAAPQSTTPEKQESKK